MDPRLRLRLALAISTILALITGWQIANENLFLIGAAGSLLTLWLVSRFAGIPADALLGGGILVG